MVGKVSWRRAQQSTPVFLAGESMDRGAWWATVHRVTKSQTRLSNLADAENKQTNKNNVTKIIKKIHWRCIIRHLRFKSQVHHFLARQGKTGTSDFLNLIIIK